MDEEVMGVARVILITILWLLTTLSCMAEGVSSLGVSLVELTRVDQIVNGGRSQPVANTTAFEPSKPLALWLQPADAAARDLMPAYPAAIALTSSNIEAERPFQAQRRSRRTPLDLATRRPARTRLPAADSSFGYR